MAALPASARRALLPPPRPASGELQEASAPVVQPHLEYCGGRVLSQAQIIAVLWGPPDPVATSATCSGNFQSCLNAWYTDFVKSPQFDWLDEYQTTVPDGTNQHITQPVFYGVVQITPANTSAIVGEVDVENELVAQIKAGNLPAPGAADETIYEVHFPLGVDPSDNGNQACGAFCAYHSSWHSNILGVEGIFAIIPSHMPPGYSGGRDCSRCGEKSDWFANLGGSISHESIEAITDPDVGLAGGNSCSPPIGWYDRNGEDSMSVHGEVGDMCEGIPGLHAAQVTEVSVTDAGGGSYTVQREWSNQYSACLVSVEDAFTISVPAEPLLVTVGDPASETVTTSLPKNGNTGLQISLIAVGIPSNVTVTFDPQIIHAGESSTMTVAVGGEATHASFTLGLLAESGSNGPEAQTVAAVAPPDFTATLASASVALKAGAAPATLALSTQLVSGNPRGYTVAAINAPGITVTPGEGQLGMPLTVSIAAAAGTPSSTGTLPLSVKSSGVAHTLTLQATVTGDDATLEGPAGSLTVPQGGSSKITISSETTLGNAQQLQLSAYDVPSGVTVSFDPPTIMSGQSSIATVSVPAAEPLIPITFKVLGTGPVAVHSAELSLSVVPPGGGCAEPGAVVFSLLGLTALWMRKRARTS